MLWFSSGVKPAYVGIAPYGFTLSRAALAMLGDPSYVAIGYERKRGIIAFASASKGFTVTKITTGGRVNCSAVVASLGLQLPKRLKVFLEQEGDMLVADITPYTLTDPMSELMSGRCKRDLVSHAEANNIGPSMDVNPAPLTIIRGEG